LIIAHSYNGNALQTATKVDVKLGEQTKVAVRLFDVLHEDRVADFKKAAAVTVRVAVLAPLWVVLNIGEFVKDFRVGATWLTHRHVFGHASSAPPILLRIIVEDAPSSHSFYIAILL
jgi:hypothetical protein